MRIGGSFCSCARNWNGYGSSLDNRTSATRRRLPGLQWKQSGDQRRHRRRRRRQRRCRRHRFRRPLFRWRRHRFRRKLPGRQTKERRRRQHPCRWPARRARCRRGPQRLRHRSRLTPLLRMFQLEGSAPSAWQPALRRRLPAHRLQVSRARKRRLPALHLGARHCGNGWAPLFPWKKCWA